MARKPIQAMEGSTFVSIANEITFGALEAGEINRVQAQQIFNRIRTVLEGNANSQYAPLRDTNDPAVPIDESVFPDHIICLEDGRSFRSLKRHLGETYGITEAEYRNRWKLPRDYPMVCEELSLKRKKNAKRQGLGKLD
ncbi:MucR family transcriptional regulator [Brucella thiophenivorans]|uniref:ROS/MUCR transcriptional regulator family protein n=1 Tax=Brucella thiophenivorans TaxID=571255 RepID=A0A256FTN1_9HYPH|nr:MucR family transcriptional regulator [Brucella thiophenivorans]OYR18235.1 ROS/MUCR transcriptional regulator family protein [Brucella thiophenivorans]